MFDVFGDSSRHAELLLNKALGRTAEDGNKISARAICATVTALGMKAQEEIYEVLRAYNILYGFDGENLLPGVRLDSSITNPQVENTVTKEEIANACRRVNHSKLEDIRFQVDYMPSLRTVDLHPESSSYIFMDDVGTPHQREVRKSPNHEGIPRKTKTVQTTNGVMLSKEGAYSFSADKTEDMCMMIRGYLLKNHLLENRTLSCFSDGARTISSNLDKWFSFCPHTLFVDWYHMKHKSNELFTRILSGNAAQKADVEAIKLEYFKILWTGNISRVIDYLLSIDCSYLKHGRNVNLLVDYLKNKAESHTIPVFAVRKQLKQVNASSRSESSNCSMTTSRQKKQGKSWSNDGSHSKTTWRHLYANNEVANVMNHRALRLSPINKSEQKVCDTDEYEGWEM